MGYQGKILWTGGKLMIQTKDKFVEWAKQFPDEQWISFTAEPIGEINTSDQQKLYFTWRDILAEYFGWTKADMHDYLKTKYNDGNSTKGMTTKEWSAFMVQVSAFSGEQDITLPTGNSE